MEMEISVRNIYEGIPDRIDQEFLEVLMENNSFRIERIISRGHSSPQNYWYDQPSNEFVLLISGSAEIKFEKEKTIYLKPGDYLAIPARKKHRVEKTDPAVDTVWFTIHY